MSGPREQQDAPSFNTTQDENPILWALQQYQKVIRHWIGALSAVEFVVLMQIVDRTIGWQKTEYVISISNLLVGGSHYQGIEQTVKKAALMKALKSLETKGFITRTVTSKYNQRKTYTVNTMWALPQRAQANANTSEPSKDEYVSSLYDQQLDRLNRPIR